MFLSKLTLPSGVTDYEVHQHLHLQFDRAGRGFLFRIEKGAALMLSIDRPKCRHKELPLSAFRAGYPLPFCADLVITKTRAVSGKPGQRYDIRDHDERRAWLRKQLQECADVPFVRFRDKWMTLGNGTRRIVASCTGTLSVTAPADFARLVQAGVGRSRAFGCGLIWIPEVMQP